MKRRFTAFVWCIAMSLGAARAGWTDDCGTVPVGPGPVGQTTPSGTGDPASGPTGQTGSPGAGGGSFVPDWLVREMNQVGGLMTALEASSPAPRTSMGASADFALSLGRFAAGRQATGGVHVLGNPAMRLAAISSMTTGGLWFSPKLVHPDGCKCGPCVQRRQNEGKAGEDDFTHPQGCQCDRCKKNGNDLAAGGPMKPDDSSDDDGEGAGKGGDKGDDNDISTPNKAFGLDKAGKAVVDLLKNIVTVARWASRWVGFC